MAERPATKRSRLLFALLAVPAVLAGLVTIGVTTAAATTADPTTSVATVSPTSTQYGSTVTYTITVTSPDGTPQGAAQFLVEGQVLCGVATLTNGVGSCTASTAPVGTDVITADFPGNTAWAGSSGNTNLTVAADPTTSVATVSPTSTHYGSTVTYTITVTSPDGTPQGAAQFLVEGQVLCGVAALTNGVGQCAAFTAPAGNDVITADFPGNGQWAGSFGDANLTVVSNPTTSTATVDPTSTNIGSSVTYTITVTSPYGTPQGAAQFLIGDKVLCTVASLTNGTGFCATTSAPAGTDVITADFPGNPAWAGSSGTTTLTVNVPPPPAPFGVTGSSSGANVNQTGDVVVHEGELYAQGNGPGSITVATYSADPTSAAVPSGLNVYGDVAIGNGSAFSSLYVIQCDEGAGASLMFFNGTAWQEFSSQSNSADCIFGVVTSTTSPTLAQLTGTPVATTTLPPPNAPQGYWMVASDGGIFAFHRGFYGSTGSIKLNQPIVGMAATHDDGGYWMAASDGGVFAFGDATFFGSLPAENNHTGKVVAILADPATGGYVLIRSDGTVWDFHTPSFGDLPFFGYHVSDIVGGAFTPDGRGLYLVGSDGRVYALNGDDVYQGDVSALHLNAPVIGLAVDPVTGGYWELAKDGGVFSFHAPFFGSTGNLRLNKPVVGMTASADGGGYWFVASDGGIFSFGDAQFYGSTGSIRLNQPVVGMAGG